ncbi:Acyl-CoA:lysophosphatidylglycerol acyltransferase 1 [Crenichthys baileyi]|uniref:Acyl-CoA:lysophosphatidylglycerol acyltransferase 1 n=1 Tax=Crenichthys baileyi TaxID=28760 RepID=A0AAV9RCY9_9TELE
MAQLLDGAGKLSWVLFKSVLRFTFMFLNNCVAIPSYCLYLLLLQPLRICYSSAFWHIEGVMFKWLLAMVSSWGWISGYTVTEWGDDVRDISEEEAMVIVNHQSTGDVCTLMMCLQDKGTVVRKMMWLMDHVFKYTNFGLVSLIHGDFFIRQGKAHRDKQLVYLKEHLEKYYHSRDRKWIVLFPEGGFLRKRRETSQMFAKKNSLPHLTHVTLPRLGATHIILKTLSAQQENGSVGSNTGTRNQTVLITRYDQRFLILGFQITSQFFLQEKKKKKTLLRLTLTLPDALQRCPELADSLRDKWGHLEKIGFDVNVRAALFQPCTVIQAKCTAQYRYNGQGSHSAEERYVP